MYCGNEKLKIVSILAMCDFPLWKKCFNALCEIVDEIYVRFDLEHTSEEIKQYIQTHEKVKKCIVGKYEGAWLWREDLIRMLDDVKPDIVIAIDNDEILDVSIKDEILEFWHSNKKAMMVSFNGCPTSIGKRVEVYPAKPHMKIFKWVPNLTYKKYCNYAQITQYAKNFDIIWNAISKIDHYCMWTKEMEDVKKVYIIKKYGIKAMRKQKEN